MRANDPELSGANNNYVDSQPLYSDHSIRWTITNWVKAFKSERIDIIVLFLHLSPDECPHFSSTRCNGRWTTEPASVVLAALLYYYR